MNGKEQCVRDILTLAHMLRERMMNEDEVRFCYKKNNGVVRVAVGTLKKTITPELKGTGRPLKDDLQLYYDVEKQAFRCFKKINLISIEL